jgi:hypothetical protein
MTQDINTRSEQLSNRKKDVHEANMKRLKAEHKKISDQVKASIEAH